MIWSFDYAPDQTLAWPDGWPGTDHPLAKQRHEDAWSLFLPGERLNDLKALLEKRASNQAIRISGKKWSADWRPVYPGDDIWKRIRELTR